MSIDRTKRLSALALGALLVVSACADPGAGGSATPAASSAAPTDAAPSDGASADPSTGGEVTGSIFVTGSSTVQPISEAVAEAFKDANPGFDYTVEGPGTGDGFQTFCAGDADIADASRQIRAEGEADVCAQNGVEYVELKVAIDGISVLTSPANDAVTCLSFPDLYALIGPESTAFDSWDDATTIASELGSSTTFPAAPLAIYGPGEESGTFDSFVEIVMGDAAEARGQDETTRPDYTASPNDNAIIEGIASNDTSLGWVGFAFYEENLDSVRAIQVAEEANGTCVEPTAETIASNEYPISRDLYIYVNTAKAAENPAVAAYVDSYLADGTLDTVLETVPYVALTPDALAESQAAWEAAKP